MESPGAGEKGSGFSVALDTSSIVSKLDSVSEARELLPGCIIGDLHGGLTFSDAVAAALEARSTGGWQELHAPSGEIWTIIILNW